jgi:hypothetical protein
VAQFSSYTAALFKSGFVDYCARQDCRFIRQNIDDAGGDKERLPEHLSAYFSSFIILFLSFYFVRFSFNFFPSINVFISHLFLSLTNVPFLLRFLLLYRFLFLILILPLIQLPFFNLSSLVFAHGLNSTDQMSNLSYPRVPPYLYYKGKAIPLQAWSGPDVPGSWFPRSHDNGTGWC